RGDGTTPCPGPGPSPTPQPPAAPLRVPATIGRPVGPSVNCVPPKAQRGDFRIRPARFDSAGGAAHASPSLVGRGPVRVWGGTDRRVFRRPVLVGERGPAFFFSSLASQLKG